MKPYALSLLAVLLTATALADDKPGFRSLAGHAEEGTFLIYQNEEVLGTVDYTWRADGAYDGTTTLKMAGQTLEITMKIEVDENGIPIRMKQTAPTATVESEASDKGLLLKVLQGGKERKIDVELKPNTILFENYSPAIWAHAVRHYDKQAGGKQTLQLFLMPQGTFKTALEHKERITRTIGGRDVELDTYTYYVPGVDVTLFMQGDKLLLADVPAQSAAMVRKGFESLRTKPESDPLLSKPEMEVVVDKNTMVPMRDGVKLATDIYRPDKPGKYPIILIRTPYQKNMQELEGRYYARRGYVAAIQDCRGRFASEGDWEPFVNEAHDGYDAVEWLAGQSWSSGKVGMIGASYLGWVQWWAASQQPPHLVTIIPNVSPPGPFYNIPYEYGVFFLTGAIWWAEVVEKEATADLSGSAMQEIGTKKYRELLQTLPVIDLDEKVLGQRNEYWRRWVEHNTLDGYWESSSFGNKLDGVTIPVFHQSGWFDGDGIGSKLNYAALAATGNKQQKLVLGPWGHTDQSTRMIGDRDFGEEAVMDLSRAYLRWFDHHLKGVDNGINSEPLVSLFVMGADTWLHGPSYPLPQTRFEKWYFSSAGSANTSKGDGKLLRETPSSPTEASRYTYDPGDPTPAPSFAFDDEEEEGDEDKVVSAEELKERREGAHLRVTDARKDILVFTSEPMEEAVTICGPVSARLYASTSGKDTDWFVRVIEIDEDGKLFPLVEGKLRARFRDSMRKPELVEPGKVYAYDVDLWQTGIEVKAGHRLRVEVASASFPMFSRNLNTGGHNEMETSYVAAEQVIYHSEAYPSHVLLPVIPSE